MYESILTEIDAGVGIITLNRPEQHNAIDETMVAEIVHALTLMEHDVAVRVIVLSSTGTSFCIGADLDWMRRAANYPPQENLRDARALADMLRTLAHMRKPTMARVQGPACREGIGLVAACDVAIATFDAQFTLSEVKLGIIPAIIGPYVIDAIGKRHARRYMLTGERFAAVEAYRIGLLHEIVADNRALDAALGDLIASTLCNGPMALSACKELVRAIAEKPHDGTLFDDTERRIAAIRASPEAKEGIGAFLEKRKPNWIDA